MTPAAPGDLDQDSERDIVVDDGLAHIEDIDIVFGQDADHACDEPFLIRAGDVDEEDL